MDELQSMQAPSSSAVASSVSTGGSTQARRLTKAGCQIRLDYFNNVTRHPTKQQKQELLLKLNALPGCEHFSYESLSAWFSTTRNTRNKKKKEERVASTSTSMLAPASSHDILYPSLTPAAITKLTVLTRELPSPTPEVVQIWAKALNVSPVDISTWIDMRQALGVASSSAPGQESYERMEEDEEKSKVEKYSHLPTPAKSTSPEPSLVSPCTPISPLVFKSDPLHSPTIPSIPHIDYINYPLIPSLPFSHYSASLHSSTSPDDQSSPIITKNLVTPPIAEAASQCENGDMSEHNSRSPFAFACSPAHFITQTDSMQGCRDISPQNGRVTAEQFAEMFAPYEIQMEKVLSVLSE